MKICKSIGLMIAVLLLSASTVYANSYNHLHNVGVGYFTDSIYAQERTLVRYGPDSQQVTLHRSPDGRYVHKPSASPMDRYVVL